MDLAVWCRVSCVGVVCEASAHFVHSCPQHCARRNVLQAALRVSGVLFSRRRKASLFFMSRRRRRELGDGRTRQRHQDAADDRPVSELVRRKEPGPATG